MAAFFTACQPELVSTEPVQQNTINVILDSWQHLEKTQPKVAYNIKQLKQQTQLNRYSSNYNFYINDSTVQVIEQPNYTTFTFFVYRDSLTPNILENYTYKLYNDGTYEQFLLKYHYTLDQDLNKVFSETQFDIEAIDDNSLLYGRTNSCVPEFVTVQTGVVCTVAIKCTGAGKHEAGHPDCVCETNPICEPGGSMQCNPTYTVQYNSCGGSGATSDEPDPNQNTNTTNGGNTQDPNSGPYPNNNNTIATPLEDPTPVWQGILDCINNPNLLNPDTTTIDSTIFESLGLSKTVYQTITNYLDDQNCSESAQSFIIEAFDAIQDGGEADFEEQVILDESFKDSETQCIHNKLKTTSGFYKSMLSNFSSQEARGVLVLKIGPVSIGDWGTTQGSYDNYNEFIITTSSEIENSSNLKKMLTLSHELIHAYMYSSLENWGLINYDVNGNAILNLVCINGIDYNNINLNTLNEKDRFVAILCAFNQNGNLTEEWTHDLFNSAAFDTDTYRESLKDLLIDSNDWINETMAFKNEAIDLFGENNWIEKVAEATSWIGLENTQEYLDYISSINNPLHQFYILDIKNKIEIAKSNCI